MARQSRASVRGKPKQYAEFKKAYAALKKAFEKLWAGSGDLPPALSHSLDGLEAQYAMTCKTWDTLLPHMGDKAKFEEALKELRYG